MSSEQGKFSADIGEDVIAAALESVEKKREAGAAEEVASAPPSGSVSEEELVRLRGRVEALEARERELEAQVSQERERTLRAVADLDNARKRAQRERDEVVRFGLERVLKDLLPVIDNLDRALDLGERTGKWDGLAEGVRMTRKLLEDTLAKQGLKAFSARGQPFDPHLHEAMGHEDREDVAPNAVSTEVLRGFTLYDRLVRPALVMVARAPASGAPPVAEPASTSPEEAPGGQS
ncbi:MAG TPA: nucleotide exchange factor GrpE [Myxococcaceae bacterium]|nr:nucleotide exchange factor GrpE [Myxococcaceae bacterium]